MGDRPECQTCRWWRPVAQRPTAIDPRQRGLCNWPCPPWVHGDRMRYDNATDCPAHEPEAMPHG